MLEGLLHLFSVRPWKDVLIDVLDLLIVTVVIYRALIVLRGTRAMQMGLGLGVIFLIFIVSKWLNFLTLYNLLSSLLSSVILIVVVVFQNDIRRGLMRVGSRAFFAGISRQQESRVIDEVVAAATELARHRMGALICFEQDANLDEFVVGQGTNIDAQVQRELLVGIFVPESVNKLHDGAVVIRNLRVAKAGVFFPMPDTKVLDKSLGSRHRAALGITEETDAVVVVVSEERGTISFCFNGNIISNLDGASLRQALLGLFGQRARKKKGMAGKKDGRTSRLSMPPSAPIPSSGERSERGERTSVLPPSAGPASGGPPPSERGERPSGSIPAGVKIPTPAPMPSPLLQPPPPATSFDDLSEVGSRPEPAPPRPMGQAKPIETPKPIPAITTPLPTPSGEEK